MLEAKVPPVESLRTLVTQTKNSEFREKILKVTEEIESGTTMSKAFSLYPKLFSSFYVAMLRSGEATGELATSLVYIADHLEREYNLLSKVRGAMIYPFFILFVLVGVFAAMMIFVVPNLVGVLEASGQELPMLTKATIAISDFLRFRGWIVLIALFGLLSSVRWYIKTEEGKKNLDEISLKIPIIGGFLKKVYLSRLAENLSTLITGGLPIMGALDVTKEVVGNSVYKKIITEVEEKISKGETMSSVFVKYPKLIPPFFSQMTGIGEKTGQLDKTLMNIVAFYQKEVERGTENILSIMEPILILTLGLMVALLMAAIVMPLYQAAGA